MSDLLQYLFAIAEKTLGIQVPESYIPSGFFPGFWAFTAKKKRV